MNLIYVNKKYETIRQVLKDEFHMSDRLITKLKNNNSIYLNNISTDIKTSINNNDIIECKLNWEEKNDNIVPSKMNLSILYEDEWMLIVDKPPFMAIHPSCRHFDTSLSNGVRYYFDKINLKKKIRPVNRLDKDTSGIVIFAKNEYIQECLIRQMRSGIFKKEYLAIVNGFFKEMQGTINAKIARKDNSIIERCISENGESAITHYKVIKEYNNYSLSSCLLETGRTHQIRVHMAYSGHPILGDTLYGSSSPLINRQALHAYKIEIIHPITKEKLIIKSPIPEDMNKILINKDTLN